MPTPRPTPAPSPAPLWRRFVQLQVGLMLFGIGISAMLEAHIGLDPWSVFHQGLTLHSGLSFGRITQLVGVVLVGLGWLAFGERPGIGTLFNMALVGPWIDLFRVQSWFPAADGLAWGTTQFLLGIAIVGLASGMYIAARLGAGPRDAFVLGVSRRLGVSIRMTRIGLELAVLVVGWALGGAIGLGTVAFALLMGPTMQSSLRLFRFDNGRRTTAPADA